MPRVPAAGPGVRAWVRMLVGLLFVVFIVSTTSCSRTPTGPSGSAWRILAGRVESLSFQPFRNGRQCWVYLPPGYSQSDARYPVLYINDGENTFDQSGGMHVNRICEDLIRRGEMAPVIVVAIETGGQRFVDYTPFPSAWWEGSGHADFYLRALRDTLKPEIDRRYRTLTDPENTGIAGASLGGLVSVYAAYRYGETFGRVGAFSPSYDYRIYSLVDTTARPRHFFRWYQDTGYPDDNYINPMVMFALRDGFTPGIDFMSVTALGGEHGPGSWEHRYPDMLRFVFPPASDH